MAAIKILSFGSNAHGQLGVSSTHDSSTPLVSLTAAKKRVLGMACGANHSLLLVQDLESDSGGMHIWACGSNEKGQLGSPD
ncbi:hypothetical protein HDU91_001063, partial [Kappamyces sp. JEL0680]